MDEGLTERHAFGGAPVRTLRVDVLEGPDTGLSCVAKDEDLTIGTGEGNDLLLTDRTVSRFHVELSQRPDGILVVDHASTNGTHAAGVRIERGVVSAGAVLRLGRSAVRVSDGESVTVDVLSGDALGTLRGRTALMRRLMARIERAAKTDASVLIVGESGTGKELIARALHDESARATKPLVTVDCGSLSPTLVASELFGHERGAFTGADRQHVGSFERADGGTIFLDEIGELPAQLQTSLLGVLERRSFRRLGGRTDVNVDVRIVSATNRDLRAEVNASTFRLDLYYRLAVVKLKVPPLRERADDVPLLVEHFLRECGHAGSVDELVSPAAMASLCVHRWPGNVRELRNLIEATVAMGEAPSPDRDSALPAASGVSVGSITDRPYNEARRALLYDFEARYLKALMARAEGNVSRAAREARMDRSHLIDLLRRHAIR